MSNSEKLPSCDNHAAVCAWMCDKERISWLVFGALAFLIAIFGGGRTALLVLALGLWIQGALGQRGVPALCCYCKSAIKKYGLAEKICCAKSISSNDSNQEKPSDKS